MVMSTDERQACFQGAKRFLGAFGRVPPRLVLERLSAELAGDELGDLYGEGQAMADFEQDIAQRLGKEAAVFMPSGTMAQQVALRIWSERRPGAPVAFHPTCHLEIHEQRGYQALHGLRACLVGGKTKPLGRADLDEVVEPVSVLLIELPQREIGGQLPSWSELQAMAGWARERGVRLHLDGARLWETQPFYGRSLAEIVSDFDSVYVSFYKILGALAGAALAGPQGFVDEARVWLRRHGGNLVTQWPLMITARAGLRERLPRIPLYVERARAVASLLRALPGVRITPDPPHTNMMHVALPREPEALVDASAEIARDRGVCLFQRARACDVPGYAIVELNIGEGALAIADGEIVELFEKLLSRSAPRAELG